jgi:hypothetical protein
MQDIEASSAARSIRVNAPGKRTAAAALCIAVDMVKGADREREA